jgi:hypothetical protein
MHTLEVPVNITWPSPGGRTLSRHFLWVPSPRRQGARLREDVRAWKCLLMRIRGCCHGRGFLSSNPLTLIGAVLEFVAGEFARVRRWPCRLQARHRNGDPVRRALGVTAT